MIAELGRSGIELTAELWNESDRAVGTAPLAELLAQQTALPSVEAVWNATFNKVRGEPGIVATTAVREVLKLGHSLLERHLGNLKWNATMFFLHSYLAGLIYTRAKDLLTRGENELARQNFAVAMDYWTVAEQYGTNFRGRTVKIWRGMRAETQLILARQSDDPAALLWAAHRDFEFSHAHGDVSSQHFSYRLEVLNRLRSAGEIVDDETNLVIEAAGPYTINNREWFHNFAELHLYRGQQLAEPVLGELLQEAGLRESIACYLSAIDFFTKALGLPAAGDSPDSLMRTKRGFARARVAYCLRALGEEDEEFLDAAIDDLRACADDGAVIRGKSLPSALLTKATRASQAKEHALALELAEEGHAYCLRYPGEVPRMQFASLASLVRTEQLRQLLDRDFPRENPSAVPSLDALQKLRLQIGEILELDAGVGDSLGVLIPACKALLSAGDYQGADRVLIERATELMDAELEVELNPEWLAGNLGGLSGLVLRQLATSGGSREEQARLLERSYRLYTLATSQINTPGLQNQLALARVAMRLGKLFLGRGDRSQGIAFLHEARQLFESTESRLVTPTEENERVDIPAIHSIHGETLLRLHAFTRSSTLVNGAIRLLEESINGGNDSAAALGLLGDAYYRRGRENRDVQDLRRALELKLRSRSAGSVARENYSVSAAASEAIWELTGEVSDFITAANLSVFAYQTDRNWPWPLLQLAQLAADETTRPIITDWPFLGDADHDDLLRHVRDGDVGPLYVRAAEVAVNTTMFEQTVLGGRSNTFFLDDPHRLLSATLVLKPTTVTTARIEEFRLRSLSSHLAEVGAPDWMLVPEFLARVLLPSDWPGEGPERPTTALVTRRAAGRSLASIIADRNSGYSSGYGVVGTARRTIEYLAYIHQWSGSPVEAPQQSGCLAVIRTLEEYLRRLGIADPGAIISAWAVALPQRIHTIPGRDAHAENWLVTSDGAIVALDLEDHDRSPVLYEVVQLLEDHPLMDVDDQGWSERLNLCRLYLRQWTEPSEVTRLSDDEIDLFYRRFAFVRAVFLCGHVPRKIREYESSGSLRFAKSRIAHAHALLTRLTTTESDPAFRTVITLTLHQAIAHSRSGHVM